MSWSRLALLHAAGQGEAALRRTAAVFGYLPPPEPPAETPTQADAAKAAVPAAPATPLFAAEPQAAPALFPCLLQASINAPDPAHGQRPPALYDPANRIDPATLPPGTYSFPPPPPLLPAARLLPLLFNSLSQPRRHRAPDVPRLLRRLAAGRPLLPPVFASRRHWPARLQIIVDTDPALQPYRQDFLRIVRLLQSWLGAEAVTALAFASDPADDGRHAQPWPITPHGRPRRWQPPPPDVALLLLGGPGPGPAAVHTAWHSRLAGLQSRPAPRLWLCPRPAAQPASLPGWPLAALTDRPASRRHACHHGYSLPPPPARQQEDLLAWLAALPLLDAGLLRRLRRALDWGDSTLEAWLWRHPQLQATPLGLQLLPAAAAGHQDHYRQRHAGTPAAAHFWHIVAAHHHAAYLGLCRLENLNRAVLENSPDPDPALLAYLRQVAATALQLPAQDALQQAASQQSRTLLALCPPGLWQGNEELAAAGYGLYAAAHQAELRAGRWPQSLPDGFRPEQLQWLVADPAAPPALCHWQLLQDAGRGQCRLTLADADTAAAGPAPIATLPALRGVPPTLQLPGQPPQAATDGLCFQLPAQGQASLVSSHGRLQLATMPRPDWAADIGYADGRLSASVRGWPHQRVLWRQSQPDSGAYGWQWPSSWQSPPSFGVDEFGCYLDLHVGKVVQRLRWLPPGRFLMGSPADEPQRRDDENQHPVILSRGFWLADAACSQALWRAVMDNDPSRFTGDDLPVENVSWDDVQDFLQRLNALQPALATRLPTEAEWEYACRAGTTTPFGFGAQITPQQVNYKGSVSYAGGEKGEYRQRTVPVKALPANPWGLYQMHGNVWEWCQDWYGPYPPGPATDPAGPASGDGRVLRGGSWINSGGGCRAASRNRGEPGGRGRSIGFRFALGQ